jgi:hypothetical protein
LFFGLFTRGLIGQTIISFAGYGIIISFPASYELDRCLLASRTVASRVSGGSIKFQKESILGSPSGGHITYFQY